jgi:hypothetical protein
MLLDFSEKAFDIVILAGQSNAESSGFGDVENPYEPNERIWFLNGDFTISTAAEMATRNEIRGNFALPFARRYLDSGLLEAGRELLILRCAVGGTGFLDNRWKPTDDLFLRMMEMIHTALELNPANRLVAFLWHQGETDACHNATRDGHYANLSGLVQSVRDTFSVPDLPFVAGDFVHHWRDENAAVCAPVLQAIRDVCADIGHAAFVETDGLKSNWQELGDIRQDPIHFSRRSTYELGKRYYTAFCGI